ncbi:MAG: type II toxin-antitoxin system VapC family toxin [Hyphomicrobiales bacterium]
MSIYLDTNVLAALFRPEPQSSMIEGWLRQAGDIAISDFGAAEFSAIVSRDVRMGSIDQLWGATVLAEFDLWRANNVQQIALGANHLSLAEAIVRRFETKLGVPDALHLAIAARADLPIVSLGRRMVEAARFPGQPLIRSR